MLKHKWKVRPSAVHNGKKRDVVLLKIKNTFNILLMAILLALTQQTFAKQSAFPDLQEIDYMPMSYKFKQQTDSELDEIKMMRERNLNEGAQPIVQQSSCRQVAKTTDETDCITEAWKLFCTQGPDLKDTCTVPGAFFRKDTIIELGDIKNLVILDQMKCLVMQTAEQCSITIRLTKKGEATSIRLIDGATIEAKFVIIDSPETGVFIDKTSQIKAGGSYKNKGSAGQGEPMRGASFVGEGGYCGTSDIDYRVYGEFDMKNPDNPWDENNFQVGSMAEWDPKIKGTSGGGYIYMNIDSTHFEGDGQTNTVEANGWPQPSSSKSGTYFGGSGGYIHIKTTNVYASKNNPNSVNWIISASGGDGKQDGFGGSGGIIILDGNFDVSYYNYKALGGTAGNDVDNTSGCGTGAAGTVYFEQQHLLFISNGDRKTNKKTIVSAKVHTNSVYPEENMVEAFLVIRDGANVAIRNNDMSSIMFPALEMKGSSSLVFDFTNTIMLTIKYASSFNVDAQSIIDLTKIELRSTFKAYDINDYSILTLGSVFFSGDIILEATNVELQKSLVDPSISKNLDNTQNGRMSVISDVLLIHEDVELRAPNIFLYANDSLTISSGVRIQSLKAWTCNTRSHLEWIPKMFKCMSNDFEKQSLDYQYFLDYYNSIHSPRAQNISMMIPTITYWWNVYIMTHGQLTIHSSKVLAPKVGLCGGDITLIDTLVDTSWKGCQHDQGIGSIPREGDCAGPGAAHGGDGGYGGLDRIEEPGQDVNCKLNYPKPRYDGKEAAYEGSGGTSGDDLKENGGAGGGIIWTHTPGTTTMNETSLKSDGQGGRLSQQEQVGSGGGSGGSIYITTLNMVGDGLVSAMGGNGLRGGGGGSGGRFIMNYLRSYLSSSNPSQSFYWEGHYDVSGGVGGQISSRGLSGQGGSLGTAYHSKCFPGYEGVFCKACEIGTYKFDYSYGECQPCVNKPGSSYYITKGEDNAQCDYECDPWLESSTYNNDCLDPINLEIQRLGGMIPFFALLGLFLIFSLIIFSMLTYRAQQMNEEHKDLPEILYYVWEDDYDSKVNMRGRTSLQDFSMNDDCIWSHNHRMYLIGSNTINYPFFIPKDFPRDALQKQDRDKFISFIDQMNPKLRFTRQERLTFIGVFLIFPPFANMYHGYLRQKKYQMLQNELYHYFSPQFWGDKDKNKTLRLGVSKADHMMAYIDFLDFSQTKQNWEGVKLPMSILLAGNGTFNNPYNIDFQSDVYAKSLVLLRYEFFRDKLPIWLQNFNTQLSKLSFFKMEVTLMRDLTNVVEWIEKANISMFNHFDVKAVVYIIENQYQEVLGGQFKQKRRSFPLETLFFDAFPEMYLNLIRYVKQRLVTGRSEIRIALVFKKHSKAKQVQTEMRIKMMKEKDKDSAYQLAINRQESVLFDDTDKDAEEDRVKFDKKKTQNEGQIASQSSMGTLDSNVTFNSDTSTSSGGRKSKKPIKLVDKTQRAFSISIESSKAFELSIRKPRKKCKHHFTRIRAQLYSIYLLLVKQQGSSPKTKDLTFFFILYASVLAIDLLVVLNYTLHLFMPSVNFARFGWAFCLYPLGVPFIAPVIAFSAAFFGSQSLMKIMSNLNSYMILVNIPLVALVSSLKKDDPIYFLLLCFMVLVKMGLSATSAKVRQYLSNPRYSKNKDKLRKILKRQKEKLQKREDILGKEATQELASTNSESSTSTLPVTVASTGSYIDGQGRRQSLGGQGQNDESGPALDKDTLRDMLLE